MASRAVSFNKYNVVSLARAQLCVQHYYQGLKNERRTHIPEYCGGKNHVCRSRPPNCFLGGLDVGTVLYVGVLGRY